MAPAPDRRGVGAGIGGWVAHLVPHATPGMVVPPGMAAYFSAVVQAPLTATVIVMEMTDNQQVTVALLATSFLVFGVSRLVCRRPIYGALARHVLRKLHDSLPQSDKMPNPRNDLR